MKIRNMRPCYSRDAYVSIGSGRRCPQFTLRVGIASEFIAHLSDLLRSDKNRKLVVYLRESTKGQLTSGNLGDSKKSTLKRLESLGYELVKLFEGVENSSIYEYRPLLDEAIEAARTSGAILVAPSRDRFLRHENFRKWNSTEKPRISEYRALLSLASGVQLATVLHPDKCARGSQTKRGQKAKGTRIGRPRKVTEDRGAAKRRRESYALFAVGWSEAGLSLREIAARFRKSPVGYKVPVITTISNWVKAQKQVSKN